MPDVAFDLDLLASLWIIAFQLAASAFFSAAETALTGASRPRMHQLAQDGDRRAIVVKRLQEEREKAIGALLLGNNLANIGASAIATSLLIGLFGEAGVAYATVVMTALVLIFSEVMPKTYAINHADAVALALARPTRIVVAVLTPLVMTVRAIVRGVLKAFGAKLPDDHRIGTTEEELRGVIDLHAGPEPEVAHERAMLRGILDLDEVTVARVMTHRRSVVTVDADDAPRAIVDQVLASGLARVPLTRGQPDNIVGVLATATLMREVMQRGRDLAGLDVQAIAEKPWFIPESTTLYDQLQAFRQSDQRQALVVDEYGALMGVVSLSDILEEIIGDIGTLGAATAESPLPGVRPASDGSFVIEGAVTLRDLNRAFDWGLPDEAAATIAGLVLREARMIPGVGQVFAFHGFRFEILRRQRNQITAVRVTPPRPAEA
jgi:Mg2+/Co2+ transporter CorB